MAATVATLVGPPEARRPSAATVAPATTTGDAFLDLVDANFNKPAPRKALTENLSPTFVSSGDACLDFFFHVVPGTPSSSVASLLAAAWGVDPATALRLVANLRGVRGTGKSDREGFYAAALWLHSHHPATLALNAASVAAFGYLKDLPELLHRIVNGGLSTRKPGKKARLAADGLGLVARRGRGRGCFRGRGRGGGRGWFRGYHTGSWKQRRFGVGSAGERIAASLERDRRLAAKAAVERRCRRAEAAARAVERYSRDATYRSLHDRTADLFADLLRDDMRKLAEGNVHEFSLAAKWCPSLDKSYDRSTLLCEAIARRLFPKGSSPELAADLPDAHYAYRARERLRKAALVPLRRALKLPEVYISARAWESVVYTRVASVAMKNYKDLFLKHDANRFNAYLADVKSGKKKIAAGALLPHEIISSLDDDGVADLQWQRMVDDMRALGKLRNCVAVCDVSGSMTGLPMDVCVALGLLVSDLSDDPWRGRVITFSERPHLHHIVGEALSDKVQFIRDMEWGMNTNFQAVFDKILEVAAGAALSPDKMVRRVVVFSDMEFDQASAQPWETDYEAIVRKYTAAGYGAAVPEVVFWNLRDSKVVPVTSDQKGVSLVSGFSKNLLKLFLDGDGVVSPRAVMEKAISGPEYDNLVVFD
uniref:TROVE domain-containing protein n=1 Tax=Oryza punctata TaxID=4537 RepID=A0A0E0JWD4_ORYPU